MIVDFHTHILPGVDDGSENIGMSQKMLGACGADVCVATPHFYGYKHGLNSFLLKRKRAWESIMDSIDERPKLVLGAEVAYFPGISRAKGLDALCIEGTRLIMLELPYAPWEKTVFDEVSALSQRYDIILAHLERFMDFRKNIPWIGRFQELPVHIQINALSLRTYIRKRLIKRYITKEYVLGSDMHDSSDRGPNLLEARSELTASQLKEIDETSETLLKEAVLV
jgi:protein-tyrosine phosphatase